MQISLINSSIDVIILVLGAAAVASQAWLWMTRGHRAAVQTRRLSGFVSWFGSLFPLFGILGTVWGLMLTMGYISENGLDDLNGIVGRFSIALSTTLWGICMAIVTQLLDMAITFALREGAPADEP